MVISIKSMKFEKSQYFEASVLKLNFALAKKKITFVRVLDILKERWVVKFNILLLL